MPSFALSLRDSQGSLDGEPEATWLIGVPIEEDSFAVGAHLSVPLKDGARRLATVVGFPLVRFVDSSWRVVAVSGVRPEEVDVASAVTLD
ncbi:hypothetical protein G5V58_11890 [Nocardioides anomalus]|uniref:Uncharacterized protein n=1 Tax=Nocardioides anomalus TaxID=2712223 RepID=A0A6G6WDZ5_9ACTN|nr:hypothetical protein [Nocardioides anomalus]QIG43373.1 hypothetical protein G5V58_11890 [Nocardioides anomalus]